MNAIEVMKEIEKIRLFVKNLDDSTKSHVETFISGFEAGKRTGSKKIKDEQTPIREVN